MKRKWTDMQALGATIQQMSVDFFVHGKRDVSVAAVLGIFELSSIGR